MTLRRSLLAVSLVLLALLPLALTACSAGEDTAADTPEMTREQRDSAIAELPIPGMQGVRGARDAAAAAEARAEAHDTIR